MASNTELTNSDNSSDYDLIIVGAGSAGFAAAIAACDQGARVALVGSGTIGGTCTNIGCLPSKTLIRAVERLHSARVAARFAGIEARANLTDWRATIRQKNALVSEQRQAKYTDLLPHYDDIAYIEGAARLFENAAAVDGRRLRAPKIVITTGARPAVPAIPGIDSVPYLTSTSALDLDELPKSLLVIGGGYIGAELAQLFARAGVAVRLVCRSNLLPKADVEIGEAVTEYLAAEGITIVEGIAYRAIARSGAGVTLTVTRDGRETILNAEAVLIAAGRAPNTEHLGLAELGIGVTGKGAIIVNEHMRTTRPGVYAAGDVTDRDQFVYMAAYGARLAAMNALNGDTLRYDNAAMPSVVFTDPQVASVGLTEAQARSAGYDVRISTVGLEQVPRAFAARDTRGLIKLIADRATRRLLGAHVIAPEGADSIQTAVLALRHGLTIDDLTAAIFPYLTTVEGLKLAAQGFDRDLSKLSCCAG
jgi:mercuric reductase